MAEWIAKKLGYGDEATINSLDDMKRLALRDSSDPVVTKIAKNIENKCGEDEACKAYEVFNYVFKNIKYKYDHEIVKKIAPEVRKPENVEYFSAPKYLLSEVLEGDCDDMSCAIASIFTALGMPVNFKVIAWKEDNNNFSHVYCEVGLFNVWKMPIWIPIDPVIKEFGKEKAPVKRTKMVRVF